MSSYSSRNNRYYDSVRQSHSGNSRSQSGNPGDDENIEGMSEDLQKIFDGDSKCSRLFKKKFFVMNVHLIYVFNVFKSLKLILRNLIVTR
jgi:hypothetical protein